MSDFHFVNEHQSKNHLIYLDKVLPQVKMVILPELSISYIHREPQKQSQNVPGQRTSLFSSLAKKHGVWLIPGSIYEKSGKNTYNTALVFSPKGELVGKYRKRYPWYPYEKTTPGKDPIVFRIEGIGTIGLMICYDLWFPEVARDLTNLGAEMIVIPTMTTTGDRYQESILVRATAITQQCYVLSCNGVGFGGVGKSMIVDPEGYILQESGSSTFMQTSAIDFNRVKLIREMCVAGVTFPLKDYRQNKQTFTIYKEKSDT